MPALHASSPGTRTLLSLADRARRLESGDRRLDRDICLHLRYLGGRIFADWLVVLPDHRLASADGTSCAEPDALTSSIDAVERLRHCLLPGSRVSVESGGGQERFRCRVHAGAGPGEADTAVAAASEPCARLAALLRAAADSRKVAATVAGEPAMLSFALIDK